MAGFLGWFAPSNIGVPAFGGQSLFGAFTKSIGEQLAHFPTVGAAPLSRLSRLPWPRPVVSPCPAVAVRAWVCMRAQRARARRGAAQRGQAQEGQAPASPVHERAAGLRRASDNIYTYTLTLTLPCPALPISQGPALTDDFWILMGRRGHMARLPGWSAALRCAPPAARAKLAGARGAATATCMLRCARPYPAPCPPSSLTVTWHMGLFACMFWGEPLQPQTVGTRAAAAPSAPTAAASCPAPADPTPTSAPCRPDRRAGAQAGLL